MNVRAGALTICFLVPVELGRAGKLPHPAEGTTIVRFEEVDEGVFRGSTPHNEADYRFLQSMHVKYILDLDFLPIISKLEEHRANRYGIVFMRGVMNASPMAPSEKHVNRILATLRDSRYRPIYFHCALGRDRTSLIGALYKMYFLGMSPDTAWREEIQAFGFHDNWTLRGLKSYFQKHQKAPPELLTQ